MQRSRRKIFSLRDVYSCFFFVFKLKPAKNIFKIFKLICENVEELRVIILYQLVEVL